jgi:hypothetical protein
MFQLLLLLYDSKRTPARFPINPWPKVFKYSAPISFGFCAKEQIELKRKSARIIFFIPVYSITAKEANYFSQQ